MKLFQNIPDAKPLGPVLREARDAFSLSLEDVARVTHLTLEEIQALEEDRPLDPRRARIQAVAYLRFLQMNPTDFKDSLPPLPEFRPRHQQFLSNASKPVKARMHSPLEILAPMGRFAVVLIITVTLLGTWGLMRQLSRVRSMPWISSTYPTPSTSASDIPTR